MRRFATGRGMLPLITADTLHLWGLNESTADSNARDLCSANNETLTRAADPGVATSPVGGCRDFNGSSQYFYGASASDEAQLLGDHTVEILFKADANSGEDVLVSFADNGEDEADNALVYVALDGSLKLKVLWEYSTGTNVSHTFTEYTFTAGVWYHVVLTFTVAATTSVSLWVNGDLIATEAGKTNSSSASGTQQWYLGCYAGPGSYFDGKLGFVHITGDILTQAGIEENARRAMLFGMPTYCPIRVDVADYNGDYQDLSSYFGRDFVDGVEISDSSDVRVGSATLRLMRQQYSASLAKWHDNVLNTELPDAAEPGPDETTAYANPNGTSTELLELGRGVKLYSCRLPADREPESTDWVQIWQGQIREVDWASDIIVVKCADDGCVLKQSFVESTTPYTSLISGASDPVATVMAALLTLADTNNWFAGAAPTITTIGTPAWDINAYRDAASTTSRQLDRVPILDALNTWAESIGWVIRYRWYEPSAAFALCFYEPDRDRTDVDFIIEPTDHYNFSRMSMSIERIRNVVHVVISSRAAAVAVTTADVATGGGDDGAWGKPLKVIDYDATSYGKYGRQFCEISFGSTDNIDTQAEAERFAKAILDDLKEPEVLASVQFDTAMPEIELHDMLRFKANDVHFTSDMDFSAYSLKHTWSSGGSSTTVELSAKPSGGAKVALMKGIRQNGAPTPITGFADAFIPRANHKDLAVVEVVGRSDFAKSSRFGMLRNPMFEERHWPSRLPDAWNMPAGTYGTDATIDTTNQESGAACISFLTNTAQVVSDKFPVQKSGIYQAELRVKSSAAGKGFTATAYWYKADKTASSTASTQIYTTVSCPASWQTQRAVLTAPSDACYCALDFVRTGATGAIYLDRVGVAPAKPAFRATMSADQNPSDKTWTLASFNTETFDIGGNYTNTASNYKFTCPEDGYYEFTLQADLQASTALTAAYAAIYVDGAAYVKGPVSPGTGNEWKSFVSTGIVWLTNGQYVQAEVYIDGTGTLKLEADNSFFSGRLVAVE